MLDSDLLTVRDVALYLRVDDTTVRKWIAGGKLPAFPLPRKGKRTIYRIPQAALMNIRNNIITPLQDTPDSTN